VAQISIAAVHINKQKRQKGAKTTTSKGAKEQRTCEIDDTIEQVEARQSNTLDAKCKREGQRMGEGR